MKKETIDFNIEARNAFGEVVKERQGKDDKEGTPVMIGTSVVNLLSHPQALTEDVKLDGCAIVKRLTLQQKIASKTPQVYTTDELSTIRESVINLFNKRVIPVELAGTILKMTE